MTPDPDLLVNLQVGDEPIAVGSLAAAATRLGVDFVGLPLSLRLLASNVLDAVIDGHEPLDMLTVLAERRGAVSFRPRRVLHQDYTGTAALADLAALRDAVRDAGGDPAAVNPAIRTDFVVDHSLRVDETGHPAAAARNLELELARNGERYSFLAWATAAFDRLTVIPPGVGIVHQVNLEMLANVAERDGTRGRLDSMVGTDSHSTMVGALCVLGWGVGGVEAEAAMLGQPIPVSLPATVRVVLQGGLEERSSAMDAALAVLGLLRAEAPIGAFVEFAGPGLDNLPLTDRATIANMAPEYGATTALFPIDRSTTAFLAATGRSRAQIALITALARHYGLDRASAEVGAADIELRLDLSAIRPTVSGPMLPQQARALSAVPASIPVTISACQKPSSGLRDGAVAIAAITSCTNTSNPASLIAAALLARNACAAGLRVPEWVKTSFTPGSPVVPDYLGRLGLLQPLEELGFAVVGFGCATCAGGSGDLTPAAELVADDVQLAAVLSGNRNFQGRIHPQCALAYLASPALVVAYALVGSVAVGLDDATLVNDDGDQVRVVDLWPPRHQVERLASQALVPRELQEAYARATDALTGWGSGRQDQADQSCYAWGDGSTWLRRPPFAAALSPGGPISDAAVLLHVGDDITTDHISPAGAIPADSPAGRWLLAHGESPEELGTYGARRANHEVMVRGTFANPGLRDLRLRGAPGGHVPAPDTGEAVEIHEAARRLRAFDRQCVVLAGRRYGSGSSRDWAAKGTALLGVRAVIAQSFERIHRANLVWLGVLPIEIDDPLEPHPSTSVSLVGTFERPGSPVVVHLDRVTGPVAVPGRVRIDNEREMQAYRAGGLLPLTLADFLTSDPPTRRLTQRESTASLHVRRH